MEDWVKDFCDWNPDESPTKPVSRSRRKTLGTRRRSLRILRRQSIDCSVLNTTRTQREPQELSENVGLFLHSAHDRPVSVNGETVTEAFIAHSGDKSCDTDDYGTVWLNVDEELEGKPTKRRKPSEHLDHHEVRNKNVLEQGSSVNLMVTDFSKDDDDRIGAGRDYTSSMSSAIQFRDEVDKIWSDLNAFGSFDMPEVSTAIKNKMELSSTTKKRRQSVKKNRRRTIIGIPSVPCKSLHPLLTKPAEFNPAEFQSPMGSTLSANLSRQWMAEELHSPEICRSATPEVQIRDMEKSLLQIESKSSEEMDNSEGKSGSVYSASDLDKGFLFSPLILDQDQPVFSPATPNLLQNSASEPFLEMVEMKTDKQPSDMETNIDITASPCVPSICITTADSLALPGGTFTDCTEMSSSHQSSSPASIHVFDSPLPELVDTPTSSTDHDLHFRQDLYARISNLGGISEDCEMESDDGKDRTETIESSASPGVYEFTALRDFPSPITPGQPSDNSPAISTDKPVNSQVPTDFESSQEIQDDVCSIDDGIHSSADLICEEIPSPLIGPVMIDNTSLSLVSVDGPSATPTGPGEDNSVTTQTGKPRSRKRKKLEMDMALLCEDMAEDESSAESSDQSASSRRSSRLRRRSVELFREQRKISEYTVDETGSPIVAVSSEDGTYIQAVDPKASRSKGSAKPPRKKRAKKAEKLEDIYLNKLYKKPNEKMYETIYENPIQQRLLSQKRYRRSITFDLYSVQPTKAKKRLQKANKLGWGPNSRRKRTISKSDFDKKLSALEADLGNLNTEMALPEVCSETDTLRSVTSPGESGDS